MVKTKKNNKNGKARAKISKRIRLNTTNIVQRNPVPFAPSSVFLNRDTDRIRVHRTIPIGAITGTATFEIQRIILNPGNPQFGWLSRLAMLYETYKFRSIHLMYLPDVPATTAGYVDLAIDWDVTDLNPHNRSELLSYKGASTGQVYVPRKMDVMAMANFQMTQKYVSDDPHSNQRNLDVGVIMYNCNVASEVGNLFLEVDLDLFTPQIQSTKNPEVNGAVIEDGVTARYAVLPSELIGARVGEPISVGGNVYARLPNTADVGAGFRDNLPIYTVGSEGADYNITIASTDGAASANQSISAVTVGPNYFYTELFEKALGTLSKVAMGHLIRSSLDSGRYGWQPFVIDATAAVTDMLVKFVKEQNPLSDDVLATLARVQASF
jgi:hypothetical protein